MGAVVRVWLKSLIDTITWGQLHSALDYDDDNDNEIMMTMMTKT